MEFINYIQIRILQDLYNVTPIILFNLTTLFNEFYQKNRPEVIEKHFQKSLKSFAEIKFIEMHSKIFEKVFRSLKFSFE